MWGGHLGEIFQILNDRCAINAHARDMLTLIEGRSYTELIHCM